MKFIKALKVPGSQIWPIDVGTNDTAVRNYSYNKH